MTLGLADFANYKLITVAGVYNNDACISLLSITSRHGETSMMMMMYRPLFPGTMADDIMCDPKDGSIRDHH